MIDCIGSQPYFSAVPLRCCQVYNFNVPTFGKGVVYDVEQKVRTEQFRFFTEALKRDRLKKYVPMFAAEAEVGLFSPTHGSLCEAAGLEPSSILQQQHCLSPVLRRC